MHVTQLGQVALVHLQLDLGVRLHALEDVQPAPATVALDLVRAVGDALQLLQDEAWHDHLGIDDPRITNIGNPSIDDDAGIENERAGAFELFGKFDIRDNKAKLIFGLHQNGHRDVATHRDNEQTHKLQKFDHAMKVLLEDRLQGSPEKLAKKETHQQAKVERGNRCDLLIASPDIDGNDHQAEHENQGETDKAPGRFLQSLVEKVKRSGGHANG